MRNEETVKLISADGFEFVIDRTAAMVSKTLRNMLTSPGKHLSLPLFLYDKIETFDFEFNSLLILHKFGEF
jgi:Skp1 family, tetramerisation domain